MFNSSFGQCPRCGGAIHSDLNQISQQSFAMTFSTSTLNSKARPSSTLPGGVGLNICGNCGWNESRNNETMRQSSENRTIIAMAVAAGGFLVALATLISWGGYWTEAPLLKAGQMAGVLSYSQSDRLAEICINLGKYPCAKQTLIESAQKNHQPTPLVQLAKLQLKMQDSDSARISLNSYFEMGGKDGEAAFLLAQIFEHDNDMVNAMKFYEFSIANRPETLPIAATGAIVRILTKQGQYDQAYQRIVQFYASSGNAKGYLNAEFAQLEATLKQNSSKSTTAIAKASGTKKST